VLLCFGCGADYIDDVAVNWSLFLVVGRSYFHRWKMMVKSICFGTLRLLVAKKCFVGFVHIDRVVKKNWLIRATD